MRKSSRSLPSFSADPKASNYWLVDRQTLASARSEDLKYATLEELGWIAIWSANGQWDDSQYL